MILINLSIFTYFFKLKFSLPDYYLGESLYLGSEAGRGRVYTNNGIIGNWEIYFLVGIRHHALEIQVHIWALLFLMHYLRVR